MKPSLIVRRTHRASVFLVLIMGLCARLAHAAAPEVDDKGSFFSDGTLRQANQIIEHIYRGTTPHKDIIVETIARLPAGAQADQLAETRFQKRTSDGVMVFLVKNPRKLALAVGRNTQDHFGRSQAEQMRRLMLDRFKKNDVDGGLLEGLRYAERELLASFPAQPAVNRAPSYVPRADPVPRPLPRTTPYVQRESPRSSGVGLFGILIGLLLIGFVIWLGIKILGALFGGIGNSRGPSVISNTNYSGGGDGGYAPPAYGGGGYVPPAYGGGYAPPASGAGSFVKGAVGGVVGGVAGAYIYDKLAHPGDRDREDRYEREGRDDRYSGGGYSAPAPEPIAPPSDEGQVGFSVGGSGGGDDWGSSGGGGGDSGGDSGGGDSGGGDSGGGDSGGGGGSGGDDW